MKFFCKMTFFEVKKIICRRYVFATIVCMTIAMGAYMYAFFGFDHSDWSGECELYRNIEGKLTKESYNFLINEKKDLEQYIPDAETGEMKTDENAGQKGKYMSTRLADALMIDSAIGKCESVLQNESNRKLIIERAKDNIEECLKHNDGDNRYKIKFNKKVIETYQKQPQKYLLDSLSTDMWSSYFMSDINVPMIILVLILMITPLFVQEKETGMQNLIDTYEKGKGKLFFSKIAAGFIVTIFTAVYFELLVLLYFKILIPELKGIGYPIQTVISTCPFDITIGGFILIKIFCFSLASLLISSGIMLFSIIFSNKLSSLGASVIFVLLSYGIVFYQKIWKISIMRDAMLPHIEEKISVLKTYLFTYLFCPLDYYKKFECVNIFNYPFFSIDAIMVITVTEIAILILISYFLYVRRKRRLA